MCAITLLDNARKTAAFGVRSPTALRAAIWSKPNIFVCPLARSVPVDNTCLFAEHRLMIEVPVNLGFLLPPVGRFEPVSGLLAALLRVGLPPRGAGV
jgi:hypothetical protein